MVRLIEQSTGTGCHRDGGASHPVFFPLAVHAFSSDAKGAERECAGNAFAAAAIREAQGGASTTTSAATVITRLACPCSPICPTAIAQSGHHRRQARGANRTGSDWPGAVRLHARGDGKAFAGRSRQMPATGRDAKARPGSAGAAALARQGRGPMGRRESRTGLDAQLHGRRVGEQVPDAPEHGRERQSSKGPRRYRRRTPPPRATATAAHAKMVWAAGRPLMRSGGFRRVFWPSPWAANDP